MPNVKYLLVEWIYNAVQELSLCEAYRKVKIVSPIDFRMLNNDPPKLILIPFGTFVAKSNEEDCLDSHFAETLGAIMRRTDVYVEDLVRLADELKEHSQTHQQVLDRLGKLMKLYKMSVDAN